MHGTHKRNPYPYVTRIGYDEYEQRVRVELGNGAVTDYRYDPAMRRLATLKTQSQGYRFQDLAYTYDTVGNITDLINDVNPPSTSLGGYVSQHYTYDGLNRLETASGTYQGDLDSKEQYSLSMSYDNIHNITRKHQKHWVESVDGESTKHGTSYDWRYGYKGPRPHAPTNIGTQDPISLDIIGRTFSYDANGNQSGWTSDKNADQRSITWDDENRIKEINDKGKTSTYGYDDAGQRVIKQSRQNLTVYVNQYFTERNGSIGSKHIFVGSSRVLTKVTGGTSFIRSYDGVTDAKSPPGQSKQPAGKTNSGKAVGKGQEKSDNGKHLGQEKNAGRANNSNAKSNGKSAQSNAKSSNKSGNTKTAGVNGLEHRSARANEVAQNTCKNKHLRERYCDENGNAIPDSQESGASTGTEEGSTTPDTFMEEIVELGSQGEQLFYYHSDHLGSTGYVTRENGELHEHIQYFPFGETWVQQGGNTEKSPYLFTGKELDEETGLYYYGARYYDPRTSVWVSADAIIGQYLDGKRGMGGVFNSKNLGLFTYTHQNPVRLIDPDGNAPGDRFKTKDATAVDALRWTKNEMPGRSVHFEYSGMILKDENGQYYATEPVRGDPGTIGERAQRVRANTSDREGGYHLHNNIDRENAQYDMSGTQTGMGGDIGATNMWSVITGTDLTEYTINESGTIEKYTESERKVRRLDKSGKFGDVRQDNVDNPYRDSDNQRAQGFIQEYLKKYINEERE